MLITIVSATNRPDSLSLRVARSCKESIDRLGCETELLNLEDLPKDIAFNDMYGERSPEFKWVQDLVHKTTHFVFVVPEYNGSIPGILKILIDACVYPESFEGKWAVMVGISAGSRGNESGLRHLGEILLYLRAKVHDGFLLLPRIRKEFIGENKETSEWVRLRLESFLRPIFENEVSHRTDYK